MSLGGKCNAGSAGQREAALLSETQAGIVRGWRYVLLDGKDPFRKAWQKNPATLAEIEEHVSKGGNVGVITGRLSGGLNVLDFDGDQGLAFFNAHANLQQTVVAQTGRGLHAYFHHRGTFGNRKGTLPPGVHFRGAGGQVVAVGSVHPETGHVYQWLPGHAPDEVGISPLPSWVLAKLSPNKRAGEDTVSPEKPSMPVEGSPPPTARASRTLSRECGAVARTPQGERNNRLNKAAHTLGGYIAAGEINKETVRTRLLSAAKRAGLSEQESRKAINSGLAAGIKKPFEPSTARHNKGAFGFYNRFMDQWHCLLPPTVAGCWQVLFRHADKITYTVELSAKEIAALMGTSARTAIRTVAVLRDRGLLEITRQGGPEIGANTYRLTFPADVMAPRR